jgi:ketosteroid isomerase-like protein
MIMKQVLTILLFVGINGNCSAQSEKANSEVNQTIIQLFDGIAGLDMKKIQQHTTKDVMLLEDGVIWNMDSIVSIINMFKSTEFTRTNKIEFIKSEVKGNIAWVAYHNTANMVINGQQMNLQWMESAVLIKEGNAWKVRLLHSTTKKPQGQ